MNKRLLLLACSMIMAVTLSAQTSGGQIRRPGTNKPTVKKTSTKKAPIKRQVNRNSTPSKAEPVIETIEIIPIQNATLDGRDVSDEAKSAQLQTVFYTVDDNLHMTNYSGRDNTQSWGPVYVLDKKEQPETSTQYATTILECSWDYQSDFEDKTGTAPVTIEMVNRGDGTNYIITIKADQLIVYQGFVNAEGQEFSTVNTVKDDDIQPISKASLFKYNVVLGSYSLLANARTFCSNLRARGYKDAQIYLDEKKLYRVIGNRFFNEQDALSFRNTMRATYPDAWILYIVNGKEERYYK